MHLFRFNERIPAGGGADWPADYYCRACLRDKLRVDPDNRPSLSEELGREVKQRLKLGDALREAGLL